MTGLRKFEKKLIDVNLIDILVPIGKWLEYPLNRNSDKFASHVIMK